MRDKNMDVGEKIRRRRRRLGLTLRQVSESAGLSVGFLSQIERGLATPSLVSLFNIARSIGASVSDFLATPQHERAVFRDKEREHFTIAGSPLLYSRLSGEFPERELNVTFVQVPTGYVSEFSSHEGEELMFVLSGGIFVTIGGERYDLGKGDSIHFRSSVFHSWGNTSDDQTRLLTIVTVPVYESGAPGGTPQARPTS
jgi:transcriptional regulator with XRE-family HTH domain